MTFLDLFTIFHVLVSLIEIAAGVMLVLAFIGKQPSNGSARLFLSTAAITLITGFFFPFHGVTPAIVIGALNIVILLVTLVAWNKAGSGRVWSATYAIGALALLYFNCLVLIVQSFQKVPGLHELAPIGNEPAVLVSQIVLLVIAVVAGFLCFRGTRRVA